MGTPTESTVQPTDTQPSSAQPPVILPDSDNKKNKALKYVLIVVAIALVALTAWLVWTSVNDSNDTFENADSVSESPIVIPDDSQEGEVSYKEYTGGSGVYLRYPKEWSATTLTNDDVAQENSYFTSPDYRSEVTHIGNDVVVEGARFNIYASPATHTSLDKQKDSYPEAVDTTVSGIAAIKTSCDLDANCTAIQFIQSGLLYIVSYQFSESENSNNAEYNAEFEALLGSIKFSN